MSTFWKATAVTVNSSLSYITVQTGDDISAIYPNSQLKVSNYSEPVEVKRAYMNALVPTIELFENWPGGNASGVSAVAIPSPAAIAEFTKTAQAFIDIMQPYTESQSSIVAADTVVLRTSEGKIKAVEGTAAEDVIVKSQIGTAAALNVTTSTTDTTDNALQKYGDWGYTGQSISAGADGVNIDTIFQPGEYFGYGGAHSIASSGDNPFPSLNGVFLLSVRGRTFGTDAYVTQTSIQIGVVTAISVRSYASSNWTAWSVSYDSGNDGGIIYGSNANGYYTKFPDGTLICTLVTTAASAANVANGNIFSSTSKSWTFPIAFVGANPTIVRDGTAGSIGIWVGLGDQSTNLTTTAFRVFRAVSDAAVPNVALAAIGRWK